MSATATAVASPAAASSVNDATIAAGSTAVQARINGVDRVLRIWREDLAYFEARFGAAYANYKKFANGEWTASLVRGVLEFATTSRPDRTGTPDFYGMQATVLGRFTDQHRRLRPPTAVDDAMRAKGPAVYALLAQMVLAAALFDLPAAERIFSDETDVPVVADDGAE